MAGHGCDTRSRHNNRRNHTSLTRRWFAGALRRQEEDRDMVSAGACWTLGLGRRCALLDQPHATSTSGKYRVRCGAAVFGDRFQLSSLAILRRRNRHCLCGSWRVQKRGECHASSHGLLVVCGLNLVSIWRCGRLHGAMRSGNRAVEMIDYSTEPAPERYSFAVR